MNSPKISFIFAAVLGVILSANPAASYSADKNADSSAKTELLADGHEVAFSSFVQENLTKYSKKAEWAQVEKIVTQYSQSPSQLRNLSADDKAAFEKAVSKLNKRLSRIKGQEGTKWASDLSKTTRQIQLIWDFDLESLTPGFIETPLPVAVSGTKSVM